jgi:phosphoserine phosphatase
MPVKIVFFDCDGTLTTVKSSWEYLHRRLGLWDNHADEYQTLFREGKIDYYEFCRRDALLWKGLPLDRVMEVIDEIPYHDGAHDLVEWLRGEGVATVILSTGLSALVDKVRQELGIGRAFSNELLSHNGLLTGEIKIHVEHDDKGYWVEKILREVGINREEAAAVGDGEGDRGMFESVGLAIGFHPQEKIIPILDHALHNGSLARVADILTEHR